MNVITGWGQLRKQNLTSPRGGREMEGETYLGRIPNQYLIVQYVIWLSIFKIKLKPHRNWRTFKADLRRGSLSVFYSYLGRDQHLTDPTGTQIILCLVK